MDKFTAIKKNGKALHFKVGGWDREDSAEMLEKALSKIGGAARVEWEGWDGGTVGYVKLSEGIYLKRTW